MGRKGTSYSVTLLICLFVFLSDPVDGFGQHTKVPVKTISGTTVYRIPEFNVLIFEAGMAIDADGSPHAYHAESEKALDNLGNAGRPGNWWALVTDNGKSTGNPVIQKLSDPAPGFYISTTALADGTKRTDDPTRYVDSETIPYIALPPALSPAFKKGDIALVINKKNGKRCFAIFADIGPAAKIGEGSIALANALGVNSNAKKGGTRDGILYILFESSGDGKVKNANQVITKGESLITDKLLSELGLQ